MQQRPLDFDAPRARTTDPLSSHEAATEAERSGLIARQLDTVLAALKKTGGLTSAELAKRHGLDRYMVARRLPEAERAGMVRRYEYGARQVRWEAIP